MAIIGGRRKTPRKPTLSPTKISTYLTCRLMYKYTYIHRISRFYYVPKASHTFGATLHRALEDFHRQGGPSQLSAEDLVENLHQRWVSLGYASLEEEQSFRESAEQLLQNYCSTQPPEGVTTLFTEKQLRCDMGEFVLMGRVDRVDQHPDGHLEAIDYKSGRETVREEEVRDDLAMSVYAYLLRNCHTDQPVDATIHALRTNTCATARFGEDDFNRIEEAIRAVADDIGRVDEDTVIDPEFLPNVCPSCDYLRICARRAEWDIRRVREEGEP